MSEFRNKLYYRVGVLWNSTAISRHPILLTGSTLGRGGRYLCRRDQIRVHIVGNRYTIDFCETPKTKATTRFENQGCLKICLKMWITRFSPLYLNTSCDA